MALPFTTHDSMLSYRKLTPTDLQLATITQSVVSDRIEFKIFKA